MDRQIIGRSAPVYCSRTVNLVPSPCGDRVKVRTPRNSPSGIPPSQVIRSSGRNSVTLSEKVRFGLASETSFSFSPGAMRPSTRMTPESHWE
jgi:hypothetical protein